MAKILHGSINLTKLTNECKAFVTKNKKGESILWLDVIELKTPSQYGDTHAIGVYNKETKSTIYLGNLREKEFGATSAPEAQSNNAPEDNDLPW